MHRYPSIFNDVIGPVMRGPSSSHCAAAVRIGRLARDLMGGTPENILVEFHRGGSLATTHESQGSDMGLFGGFLGWEATDPRLVGSAEALRESGAAVEIRITDFPAPHPNTYRMTMTRGGETRTMTAVSTGGGMIEVLEIDGYSLSMAGDYHELLLFLETESALPEGRVEELVDADFVMVDQGPAGDRPEAGALVQVKAHGFPDEARLEELRRLPGVSAVIPISPVLPVQSWKEAEVPFISAQELIRYNQDRGLALWELGVLYENARGGLSEEEAFDRMREVVRVMRGSIDEGLAGTEYSDRILGPQAGAFRQEMEAGRLLDGGALNRMILYVTAVMEVKSSMGVIVAAPTAGSCGALPGACFGAADSMGFGEDDVVKAILAAGVVGLFIAAHSTFAAESSGCQAETGAGAGMAAAALVSLGGGTVDQALGAASMALQNTLGLICDPVANRVEVPCLGRNVAAAGNALASANMALAGFNAVIPLDEVIHAMNEVGASMPSALRCTALGGLSVTPTSQTIEGRLVELKGKRPGSPRIEGE